MWTIWFAVDELPRSVVPRDDALGTIQPWLREHGIWSGGRFGAWLYEIGNMDHSTMQGVGFADHVILDEPERTWIPGGDRNMASVIH